MTVYSDNLAKEYINKRENYRSTDKEVFSYLDTLDIKGKRVLDFGCGDGMYAKEFLDRGAQEVVGIDENPTMIAIANQKYGSLGNTKFLVADGNNLPFEDNSFDLVFAYFVLHYFTDTLKPLKEIYRVLTPEGYFIATIGAHDVSSSSNIPLNIEVPIRLGRGENTVLVYNLLKSHTLIEEDLKNTKFKIEFYNSIPNPNAQMDKSHPYIDKIKFMTMFAAARK